MKTGSPNDRQPGIQHSLFYQFFFLVGTTRKEFSHDRLPEVDSKGLTDIIWSTKLPRKCLGHAAPPTTHEKLKASIITN